MQIAPGLHRIGALTSSTPNQEKGIAAYVHAADVERAQLKVTKPMRGWGPVKGGPLTGFLWYSATHGGLRIPPAKRTDVGAPPLDKLPRHPVA